MVVKTCPSAQRTVRSIGSIKSLPQKTVDEIATLGDEQDTPSSAPPPPTLRPNTLPPHARRPPEQQTGPAVFSTEEPENEVQCATMRYRDGSAVRV
ncbi:hypothetical protein GCM10014713_54210 [Streptomyces purpureus]|uniref:Uncharacterized protein n=1 Tax=Streptomyces purpureus TaxID=1951 RepID=A0A918LUY1_9ACTN|nr:hypothetical protein GCM10014713_54210 [Streptomyces purpureus]